MPKPLKLAGITIGAIFLLLVVAVVAIPMFVDLNDYKPQISDGVKSATGRDLKIEGDIELTLFPWVGATLGAIQLGNAPGFGNAPFARIDGAEIKIKLLPLFNGAVEAKAITLQGLNLNLVVNKDGSNNWDDLAQGEEAATPETEKTTPTGNSTGSGLAALAIGGLHISNARVSYDDQLSGARYAIEQLDLSTGPVSFDTPLDIKINTRVSSSQPQVNATLMLKARVFADLINGIKHKVALEQLTVDFDSPELASKGTLNLTSTIELDLKKEQYTLSRTQLSTDISNTDIPGGEAVIKLLADVSANLKQQTATVKGLSINSFGLDITGDINASNILATPAFSGNINIAPFDLKKLMQNMAIEIPDTADATAMRKVSMQVSLQGTPQKITVAPLKLQLDDTQLDGNLNVMLATDKPMPTVRYTLNIDNINADRYLPPVSEESETVAATPASAGAAAATLPMDTLRALDIKGELSMGQLKIMNLSVKNVNTRLAAKDGIITLAPLSANLYQGQYKGAMQLDARGDTPKISLNESLSNIHVGPLLKDFMDDDTLSGVGNVQAKITAMGIEPEAAMKTLNGTARFSFANGAIKGFNLAQLLREAKARLGKKTLPASDEPPKTDFTELSASFNIINGVAKNNDLAAKSPYVRISGQGEIDLPGENINYKVIAKVVNTGKGQGGEELAELRGLSIPVRVSGSFSDPKLKLELSSALKDKAKQKLSSQKTAIKKELASKKEAERERLKQAAEEKVKEKLKGLFNH